MSLEKKIVISAINFFEGGPLSVLKDCLNFVNNCKYQNNCKFIVLVHKKELFDTKEYPNVDFVEFPKSRKSYFFRLYYEYFYFKNFAISNKIDFWFSLHDITPSVGNIPQAVYCHNPSPFNTINASDIYLQPTQFFFRLFYRYLYQINIKKNKYVIVQQLWMKNRFVGMFDLDKNKIIVAPPQIPKISDEFIVSNSNSKNQDNIKLFFFPTFPRPFKNIEVICEAARLVLNENPNFKIIITIDGSENKYSKAVVTKYQDVKNISFVGLIKRDEVYSYYSQIDALIFPSKLETWGLPISEFKQFEKPMLIADLPYAKETVGNYEQVNFFRPDDARQLSELILNHLNNKVKFDSNAKIDYEEPFVQGWEELFTALLKD